jgi:hypothetical protein
MLEPAYSLKLILVSPEGISNLVLRNLSKKHCLEESVKKTHHLLASRLTGWDLLQDTPRYHALRCTEECTIVLSQRKVIKCTFIM